jgi:hypothetical protein
MFVVARSGDVLAVSFDAGGLPPLAPGVVRTYLLRAHGYSKEMDINSSAPDQVAPLPFRQMTGYPGKPGEAYPTTVEHREYQAQYNTRRVLRSIPPIEVRADREGLAEP